MSSQDLVYFTGPIFLGFGFNWGLFGVLTIQTWQYFLHDFKRDGLGLKVLVTFLYTIDILHTVFASMYAWDLLVGGWGDPSTLVKFPWSGMSLPVLSGLVSGSVQLFFAWRIWNLRRMHFLARILSILIVFVALGQALCAIAGGILFTMSPSISNMTRLKPLVEAWLAGAFVCDTIIAGTMFFILNHARRESSYKTTGQLMTKLMINAIETGAITAITAGVELVLFLMFTDNLLHMCPNLILSKLYTNVALANLNGRKNLSFFTPDITISGTLDNLGVNARNVSEGGAVEFRRYPAGTVDSTTTTTSDSESVSSRQPPHSHGVEGKPEKSEWFRKEECV